MPLEAPLPPIGERVRELNTRFRHHGALSVLAHALGDPLVGRIVLVSSFGAESVVLLHMVSVLDRSTPVLFVNTQMLFPETLSYQTRLAKALRLSQVAVVVPDGDELQRDDPDGLLHQTAPDTCCHLRKTAPLQRALAPYDAWITGRKRFQGGQRAGLAFFEDDGGRRIKVNPLAHWRLDDVQDYITNNHLPRHPLVARGYPSIGCAPCTSPVAPGETARAGRWRGRDKVECGIHFDAGGVVREPAPQPAPQPGRLSGRLQETQGDTP